MNQKTVLISGAGIGGLALAYWLKKYGYKPTVIEKHPTLRTEGYKIDIRGIAMDIIDKMGLRDEILAARTKIKRALMIDETGENETEIDPDLIGVREKGDIEIVRGHLCEILLKRCGDIEIIYGDFITDITETHDGILAKFNKTTPRRFDMVIGADGLHSKVRKLVFGEEKKFLRDMGIYVSFYSIPDYMNLDCIEMEQQNHKRYVILYFPGNAKGKAAFCFAKDSTGYNLRNKDEQKAFIRDAYKDHGWEVPKLLSYLDDGEDFYFDCMSQVHMPCIYKGRTTLVGDAGYCVSPLAGQGCSVALVGAYVLAGEIAAANGDHNIAFPAYAKKIKSFIKKNRKLAKIGQAVIGGGKLSKLTLALLVLANHIGKLVPARFSGWWKNYGLRKTTKAANGMSLERYPYYT